MAQTSPPLHHRFAAVPLPIAARQGGYYVRFRSLADIVIPDLIRDPPPFFTTAKGKVTGESDGGDLIIQIGYIS